MRVTAKNGARFERVEIDPNAPSPTLLSTGAPYIEIEGELKERERESTEMREPKKPPYRVPTMEEVRAIPYCGLRVASTFSGGGGSSLGYRMAGLKVVWASEFVESARETYSANFPDTPVDARDIRTVKGSEILAAVELKEGELDVLDGSPPCSAFSTAGKREAGWGVSKSYSDNKEQVVDDLFFEYARILGEVRPRAFVAENVAGLVRGTAKGYFLEILAALKAKGYRVKARVLDAQWLGVPQARQRVWDAATTLAGELLLR